MKFILMFFLFVSFISFSQDETITLVSYNILNFPEGRDDCGNNVVVPNRADTLKKIVDFIQPDILGTCEMQTQAGVDLVLDQSLNANGGNFGAANFISNGDLNNALFYNMDKLVLKEQFIIETFPRSIDHYVLYLKDPNLDVFHDTTFIEVFMTHLKAGNSSANETSRAAQTALLMDYIATRPDDRNIFVGGDMNVYSSNEAGYQNMTTGINALKDPINKPGNWHNKASFASVHSQSTRLNENYDCGAKGGMDDRFDHLLVSNNVMVGSDKVKYQVGSYRAVGNDGNHFNKKLLTGTNTMYPMDVVSALYYMSDHLPIELKLDVTYPTSNGLVLVPSHTNVTCNGGEDGSATITPHLGEAPFSYQWDTSAGNQTTQTAVGLSAGTYCVTVTDNLGEVDEYCITINEPGALYYNAFVSPDPSGECLGSLQVIVGGGTPPYSFFWNEFPENVNDYMTNLCAGDYTVIVTDANGCEKIVSRTVQGELDVDMEELNKMRIYPNPVRNQLTVSGQVAIQEVSIYTIDGRIMLSAEDNQGEKELHLDVSNLATGIYLLKVKTAFEEALHKIIVR